LNRVALLGGSANLAAWLPQRIKTWIGDLPTTYFDEIEDKIIPCGQATMRLALKEAGAEPDESWCLGEENLKT
jgi:hypothetical protein